MKILSLNIRHGGGSRLSKILDYLDVVDFDVCVLSEFRQNKNGFQIAEYLKGRGLYCLFPSGLDAKKNTVLVAGKRAIKSDLIDLPILWSCSAIRIHSLTITGVYFPLKKEKQALYDWFLNASKSWTRTIVVGDFNTGISRCDLEGHSHFYCENDFRMLSQSLLRDGYRSLHPDGRDYSWYSAIGNGFRIDHILCSPDILNCVKSVSYDHSTRQEISDHSALLVELEMNITKDQIRDLIALIDRDLQAVDQKQRDPSSWISDELSNAYIALINEVQSFDWRNWTRGLDAIQSGSDFADFGVEELMKALLAIFRGNRFTEGLWEKYLSNGTISRILNRLEDEVARRSSAE